jgi:tRNA-dihydrouridine synthase A
MGAEYGYDEINLNVGCPSDRVQSGSFGACLMATPELVRDCVMAMREAVSIPVTVKCRIGIDDQDSEKDFAKFIAVVGESGCRTFIVHARKAWLKGLSPKENREIPPLDYDRVKRLKVNNPDLSISLNGGIITLDEAERHLSWADGVMIGRAAYSNPYILAAVDSRFYDDSRRVPSRHEIARAMQDYADRQADLGVPIKSITRHLMGLFNGLPGARLWRRYLSENAPRAEAGSQIIRQASVYVPEFPGTEAPEIERLASILG